MWLRFHWVGNSLRPQRSVPPSLTWSRGCGLRSEARIVSSPGPAAPPAGAREAPQPVAVSARTAATASRVSGAFMGGLSFSIGTGSDDGESFGVVAGGELVLAEGPHPGLGGGAQPAFGLRQHRPVGGTAGADPAPAGRGGPLAGEHDALTGAFARRVGQRRRRQQGPGVRVSG